MHLELEKELRQSGFLVKPAIAALRVCQFICCLHFEYS